MGCGSSREKESGINCPLDSQLEEMGVEALDEIFKSASGIITSLEGVREKVIDTRDDLILNTGACVSKSQDLIQSFYCILWKLSADNAGDLSKADISVNESEPFMSLNGKKNTVESMSNFENLVKYVTFICTLNDKMMTLGEQILTLSTKLMANPDEMLEQIKTKFTSEPFTGIKKCGTLKANIEKVKKAAELSPKIALELSKSILFVKSVPSILKDKEKLKATDTIGKEAHEKAMTKPNEITWYALKPEERYGKTPLDGVHFFNQRKENKASMKKKK